ncbi:MAG: hypothetical protein MZW92_02670 [Comamonadaceae bacterium]|nr:hypothetical protein [Comamonadaceae bacterium]
MDKLSYRFENNALRHRRLRSPENLRQLPARPRRQARDPALGLLRQPRTGHLLVRPARQERPDPRVPPGQPGLSLYLEDRLPHLREAQRHGPRDLQAGRGEAEAADGDPPDRLLDRRGEPPSRVCASA